VSSSLQSVSKSRPRFFFKKCDIQYRSFFFVSYALFNNKYTNKNAALTVTLFEAVQLAAWINYERSQICNLSKRLTVFTILALFANHHSQMFAKKCLSVDMEL
jgi:hypothetical protein